MGYEGGREKGVYASILSVCLLCVCVCVCNGGGGELTVSYNWPGKLPGFYIHSTKKEKKKKTKKKEAEDEETFPSTFFLNTFFIGLCAGWREGGSSVR